MSLRAQWRIPHTIAAILEMVDERERRLSAESAALAEKAREHEVALDATRWFQHGTISDLSHRVGLLKKDHELLVDDLNELRLWRAALMRLDAKLVLDLDRDDLEFLGVGRDPVGITGKPAPSRPPSDMVAGLGLPQELQDHKAT